MKSKNFPIQASNEEQLRLNAQIQALQSELEKVEQRTTAFEVVLRTQLANELIEVQELTVLYKKQKQLKKEKRLAQKQRGSNYQAPVQLQPVTSKEKKVVSEIDEKERKRLYREAMLYVHPDKFSVQNEQLDLATEVTVKLIDIYQSGDLKRLQAYHAHIFNGNALTQMADHSHVVVNEITKNDFLETEKQRLEMALEKAKAQYTYKVLMEYPDPMAFVKELREYYTDKITKLRRRTRVG